MSYCCRNAEDISELAEVVESNNFIAGKVAAKFIAESKERNARKNAIKQFCARILASNTSQLYENYLKIGNYEFVDQYGSIDQWVDGKIFQQYGDELVEAINNHGYIVTIMSESLGGLMTIRITPKSA
jgi:hypothetical protein